MEPWSLGAFLVFTKLKSKISVKKKRLQIRSSSNRCTPLKTLIVSLLSAAWCTLIWKWWNGPFQAWVLFGNFPLNNASQFSRLVNSIDSELRKTRQEIDVVNAKLNKGSFSMSQLQHQIESILPMQGSSKGGINFVLQHTWERRVTRVLKKRVCPILLLALWVPKVHSHVIRTLLRICGCT